MRTHRFLPSLLALLPCLAATGAGAQTLPLEVELGYRFADVSGSDEMYRTQVNERSGFLVRTLSLVDDFSGRTGAYDRLRLDVGDLGVGPAGAARLELSRAGTYKLLVTYRRSELFSALPAFANPLFAAGIVPGEHTYDRVRHMADVDLELLPGKAVRPLLGYSWNRLSGPGRTTYTAGGDEFRLAQDLKDTEQEIRVGAAFDVGPVSGQVTQGWRKLHEVEDLSLAPGAGAGNSSGTVLGSPVSLSTFQRSTTTDANTPVTNAVVTAKLGSKIRVLGSYVRARAESDTAESESLAGTLVSFPLSAFYAGSNETVASRAKDRFWNGGGRVEFGITPTLDLSAGVSASGRDLSGAELVSTLFLGVLPFGNVTPSDVQKLLQASTSVERTDEVYFARVHARALGPFAVTAGAFQTNQHISVNEDPAEIVVPGSQGGEFERRIRSWEIGATTVVEGFTLGGEVRREIADHVVVRTDFLRRGRYRLRASWKGGWKGGFVRISGAAEQVDAKNEDPGFDYEARNRQYSAQVEVGPIKPLTLRFGIGAFDVHSTIPYRQPQDFSVLTSYHDEYSRFTEGGVTLSLAPVALDASYARTESTGTFPFVLMRLRARGEIAFTPQVAFALEFAKDKYDETVATSFGDYKANRYGLFLRYRN